MLWEISGRGEHAGRVCGGRCLWKNARGVKNDATHVLKVTHHLQWEGRNTAPGKVETSSAWEEAEFDLKRDPHYRPFSRVQCKLAPL